MSSNLIFKSSLGKFNFPTLYTLSDRVPGCVPNAQRVLRTARKCYNLTAWLQTSIGNRRRSGLLWATIIKEQYSSICTFLIQAVWSVFTGRIFLEDPQCVGRNNSLFPKNLRRSRGKIVLHSKVTSELLDIRRTLIHTIWNKTLFTPSCSIWRHRWVFSETLIGSAFNRLAVALSKCKSNCAKCGFFRSPNRV